MAVRFIHGNWMEVQIRVDRTMPPGQIDVEDESGRRTVLTGVGFDGQSVDGFKVPSPKKNIALEISNCDVAPWNRREGC